MWNLGDVMQAVAHAASPQAPCFIHDGRTTFWPDMERRARALAGAMLRGGAERGERVAFYLRNGPAYGELTAACFLAGLVHVNINFRYREQEVFYILDNADAVVVVYDAEFRPIIADIRARLTQVKLFLEVPSGEKVAPFAQDYEELARNVANAIGRHAAPHSGDDEVMAYTGGTTGMPKGVVFRQADLAPYLFASSGLFGDAPPQTVGDVAAFVDRQGIGGRRYLLACPQMHSTGFFVTMWTLLTGGCIITIGGRSLDAGAIWQAAELARATNVAIVGDPFARPMLAALDAAPGRYDLSALVGIGSSGAMWSAEVKQGLLRHLPHVAMTDVFASTETMGIGISVTQAGAHTETAGFTPGPDAIVIDEHDCPLTPGCGVAGRLAVAGLMQPLRYHKDPEKTRKTFPVIAGRRYSIPGDYAMLEADGSIQVLGRGSTCINTAGEKVFCEEVEEMLKTHAAVEDALVVGVPDPLWGQAVTGVVRLAHGAEFDEQALRAHVRQSLAPYKVPKRILVAGLEMRAPNGKADYAAVMSFARHALQLEPA